MSAKKTTNKPEETVVEEMNQAAEAVEQVTNALADSVQEAADESAEAVADAIAEMTAEQIADAAAEKAVEKAAEKVAAMMADKIAETTAPKESLVEKAKKVREEKVEARGKKRAERTEAQKKKKEEKAEARQMSKAARHQELEDRKNRLKHTQEQLSDKMKSLLSLEISEKEKKEKQRAAEIFGVFSAHNFYANGFTPIELRTTLEDLGPTYVKIGQIMSSRVDLLPESYCKELENLRANVKPLDPQIARAVIEQETGKTIDELFSEFQDKPLGSASVGQAHLAVMKDGTRVVVKVQRPLIADMMRKDYVLLKKGAALINTIGEADDSDEEKLDLLSVIEEMEKVTEEELDFRVEAENTKFFKEYCIEDETKVSCPTVIDELTTERMFTMTCVNGPTIAKKEKLVEMGVDFEELGRAIVENYLHQVLDVGTFHADPHQGNIMVQDKVPYWIDFGMIGRISESDVNTIQNLILSLLNRDLDGLVNAIMSMGLTSPKTNRNKLMEDVDIMIDKYMNVTSINDLDLSMLLEEVVDLATKHHITLPGKYTMLVRSLATIEGVIEELCPELNLFEIISGKLMERAKQSMDVSQELLSVGKEALEITKKGAKLPALTSDVLTSVLKGRLKMNMELTGYEEIVDRAEKTVLNVVLAVFACVIFFGSCILTTADIEPKTSHGVPLLAMAGIIFSIGLGIFTVKKMLRKK